MRVEQEGSDEMSSRENNPGDAGMPESDRQKSIGHVDEKTDRQGGSERSSGWKVPRFRGEWRIAGILATHFVQSRQMNT